jgi:signal transduction histidine kinase
MLWLTRSVIHTEQERAQAEIRAELQERVRLALWRMDSLGTSLLVEQNAVSRELFLTNTQISLPAKVRFETPDGAAIRGAGDAQALEQCGAQLPSLMKDFKTSGLEKKQRQTESDDVSANLDSEQREEAAVAYGNIRKDSKAQASANKVEWMTRDRILDRAFNQQANASIPSAAKSLEKGKIESSLSPDDFDQLAQLKELNPSTEDQPANPVGDFKATWHEGSLFLIRRGMMLPSFAQGALVDLPALRELLLTEAIPLLPQAILEPSGNGGDDSYNLASFPFQLHPGNLGTALESIPQTISISLIVGWLAAMIALLAALALITNVMKLSERRASFVSAVTHELRTPLTTFRLYSDMLSSGAVRAEKQATYLKVLSREADRLSHLVENVLAFSKIERGSARSTVTDVGLDELLESFHERFASRLEAAGLTLERVPGEPIRLKLDSSALEHILFNLIDNAAKYAPASEPPVVTLDATVHKRRVEIRVGDHGPGVPAGECRRIFRPFHKSAKQAAESQPGVGLGLSLSRRLARTMGGSLNCHPRRDSAHGAEFVLSLPRD